MSLKTEENENANTVLLRPWNETDGQDSHLVSNDSRIPALARSAVETFISRRRIIEPRTSFLSSLLNQPSACFVSIKTLDYELRGCIGTVEPEKSTLAEEIVANAIKAATCDPRFSPISENELPSLLYSVDVLGSLEQSQFEDLDPTIFGVVVLDHSGSRRGLLLPDIESIKTADLQVRVAAKKAGIKPDEPLRLYRFRTRRFSERDNL